jgi:hypothetical protein
MVGGPVFSWRFWPYFRLALTAVLSAKERFLAAVGSDRGQELWATIRALQAEADRVPDPGGPIPNYIDALHAWAATHPEVDPSEMGAITSPLIRDHR